MLRIILALTTSLLASGAVVSKPAGASDGTIEAAIRAKFAKSKINEEHFKVTVKSGIALLEGRTSVPQRKGVATRLAKTGGARAVVNKIEISEAARRQMADRLQKARARKATMPKAAALAERPTPAAAAPNRKPVHAAAVTPRPIATPAAAAAVAAEPPALRRMQIKR
jgi:hypothetical protein